MNVWKNRFRSGPQHICDLGCSIGISTEFLARAHHESAKRLIGIDLSPHYLAVAKSRARELDATEPWSRLMQSARFLHCAAEETHRRVGTESLDLMCVAVRENAGERVCTW
jgi:predicted O-methyltransferase YrrM